MNRSERRAQKRATDNHTPTSAYACPDCTADVALVECFGITLPLYIHDDTCPLYRSMLNAASA